MIPGPIRVEPVVLEGEHVRLEPLSQSHHAGLCEIGLVEELWRWIPKQILTPEDMKDYIDLALTERANGVSMPFCTDRTPKRTCDRQHALHEHRKSASAPGNWRNLDRSGVAADGNQYRIQILATATRI